MHKITAIIALFILLSMGGGAPAQVRMAVPGPEIDSLIRITPQFEGIDLVDHLNHLTDTLIAFVRDGDYVQRIYPDSSLYYAEQALELAQSLDYDLGEARAQWNIGRAYYFKLDLKRALLNNLLAKQKYEDYYGDEIHIVVAHVTIGIAFYCHIGGHYGDAEKYYKYALSIYTRLNLAQNMYITMRHLHDNYRKMKAYDSAIHYAQLNLNHCKRFDLKIGIAVSYQQLAEINYWRDEDKPEAERNSGPLARPYLDSTLTYTNQVSKVFSIPEVYAALGKGYHKFMKPPDFEQAEKHYRQALKVRYSMIHEHIWANEIHWPYLASNYAFLGELYADQGKIEPAKACLDSALLFVDSVYLSIDTTTYAMSYTKYADGLTRMYWRKSIIYRAYYKLYKSVENYDSAIYFLQLKEQVLDSLQELDKRNEMKIVLANAETVNVQNKMRVLEQQKELEKNRAERSVQYIIGLALLLVISLLIAFLLIRQNRMRAQQEKMGLQQKLFRTQMNPHFIFNSLSSIQHLVVDEEPEKASIYLAKFSTLVRSVLYSSNKDSIMIEDELKSIESYLALQKIRYSNKFEYTIDVDSQIDTESLTIPPMLAQPFIENAIEHGIRNKEGTGNIFVRFQLNEESVQLEVEDDGVGRGKSHELEKAMKADHRSMATQITRERLRILNRKAREKISFAIADLKDSNGNPTGTKVSIILPLEVV